MNKTIKRRLKTAGAVALAAAVACSMCVFTPVANADAEGREYVSQFRSEASSAADALERGDALNQKIVEEGMILLKNENKSLPLKTGAKITVLGKNSNKPFYGGGGSASGADGSGSGGVKRINLYDSLDNAGFEVNPTLKAFYADNSKSGNGHGMQGTTGEVSYITGETPVSRYTGTETGSFASYNDAAVVVISRSGGEGADIKTNFTAAEYNGQQGRPSSPAAAGRSNYNNNNDAATGDHHLELDDNEKALIALAKQNFDNVVIVLNTATSFELGELEDDEKIGSILWLGFPGGSGINALGKALNGEVNPSGRTVDTYARDFKKDPTFANFATNYTSNYKNNAGGSTGINYVEYDEGIYVGYRYYETRGYVEKAASASSTWYEDNVVYPFGYGLSYTTFDWNVKFVTDALDENGTVEADVTVTNTGKVAGKDVVQLYYSAPYTLGEIEKSHVALGAYEKTGLLQPGMSETVRLSMNVRDMASYDFNDMNANGIKGYELDDGDYTFYVGKNAHAWADGKTAFKTYKLDDEVYYENDAVTGEKVENRFDYMSDYFDDEATGVFANHSKVMSRADFEGTFPTPPTAAEATLSADEIAKAEEGHGKPDAAYDAGKPWQTDKMPTQAATRQTRIKASQLVGLDYEDKRWDSFMNQLTVQDLADTVARGFFITNEMTDIDVPLSITPDGPTGFVQGSGPNWVGNTCTYASPIVVASTWNKELALEMGEAVGEEGIWGGEQGVRGGYNGWYAPGNNIHRSPFSGRNFEYYSEDPVLAGSICAQVVKGVQSKGVFVMMKHFALNDQETNRTDLSTWANEQTMREIYLKSFEIAVKDGGATGMMSAFNRFGHAWAGATYGLLTEVLRNEWGFRGLVITDWANSFMSADKMVRAGNDLWLGGSGYSAQCNISATGNATHVTAMRRAAKAVLYTVVNSNAMNRLGSSYAVEKYAAATDHAVNLPAVAKGEAISYDAKSDVYKSYKYALIGAPKGITINENTGAISGTVANDAVEGKYAMHVALRDDKGFIGQGITINVTVGSGELTYTGEVQSTVNVGAFSRINVSSELKGASPTYAVTAGNLPKGMALTADGYIVGIPEEKATSTFTVTATAGEKIKATQITVTAGDAVKLAYAGKALDAAKVGEAYSANLALATGAQNVVYSASALPDGLTLSADGTLSGTFAKAGEYTIKVAAWADGCNEATVAEFTVKAEEKTSPVTPPPGPDPGGEVKPNDSVNVGAIVGGVVGGVALIGIGVAVFFIVKKKKSGN